jgi:hypothetical protein
MPGAIVFPGKLPSPAPRNDPTHDSSLPSFGVVYMNGLAREAMNGGPLTRFPAGSIIVREKLNRATDAQPQLLTVMIKRGRGFNPKANNWEFLAIDGTMTKVVERQKKGSCLDCHVSQEQHDFVYPTPLN